MDTYSERQKNHYDRIKDYRLLKLGCNVVGVAMSLDFISGIAMETNQIDQYASYGAGAFAVGCLLSARRLKQKEFEVIEEIRKAELAAVIEAEV